MNLGTETAILELIFVFQLQYSTIHGLRYMQTDKRNDPQQNYRHYKYYAKQQFLATNLFSKR